MVIARFLAAPNRVRARLHVPAGGLVRDGQVRGQGFTYQLVVWLGMVRVGQVRGQGFTYQLVVWLG